MTTAGDLIDRASSFGRDSGGVFLTETDYLAWLNEAQTDVVAREQTMEQEATTTTDGTNVLSFPTAPGLVEIQNLTLGTDDRAQFIDSMTWNSFLDSSSVPVHTLCRVFDDRIEMYPTPAAGITVTIRYKRLPTPITTAADVIEVPAQLERKLVEYMKAQARFKDGAFEEGNNWLALYEQGLAGISTGREKFFTGPLFVTREANIWDRQRGASHV